VSQGTGNAHAPAVQETLKLIPDEPIRTPCRRIQLRAINMAIVADEKLAGGGVQPHV